MAPEPAAGRGLEGGSSGNPVRSEGAVPWGSECSPESPALPFLPPPRPQKESEDGGRLPGSGALGELASPQHLSVDARVHLCSQGAGPPSGVRGEAAGESRGGGRSPGGPSPAPRNAGGGAVNPHTASAGSAGPARLFGGMGGDGANTLRRGGG